MLLFFALITCVFGNVSREWFFISEHPIQLPTELTLRKITKAGKHWVYEFSGREHAFTNSFHSFIGNEGILMGENSKVSMHRKKPEPRGMRIHLSCRTSTNQRNAGYQSGYFSWAIDSMDQRGGDFNFMFCPLNGNVGTGVHAYVVDTGIYPHSSFQNRLIKGFDYFRNVSDPNYSLDNNGHGTHVAGLIGSSIYGVAPGVTLHSYKALDSSGYGSFASILANLLHILDNIQLPAVINMSFGVVGASSSSVTTAILDLINRGAIVVASAGNDGINACNSFPANIPEVITVAASDQANKRCSFSNYGQCVDIFSPGKQIISTYLSGTAVLSGTSMSAPLTAGTCALILQSHPNYDQEATENYLYTLSTVGVLRLNHLEMSTGSPDKLVFAGVPGTTSVGVRVFGSLSIVLFFLLIN